MEKILITLDRDVMWEYFQYYKKKKPKIRSFEFATKITEKLYNPDGTPQLTKGGNHKTKTRKRSLKEITKDDMKYGVMSLNELLVIQNRMTMNGIKYKFGELGLWLAQKHGIDGKMYSNSIIEYRIYKHTTAQGDIDNLSGGIKFLNDKMFVDSKAFVDDNYKNICPLLIGIEVDKEHPRTEIRITILDDEIKDIYIKTKLHINAWSE